MKKFLLLIITLLFLNCSSESAIIGIQPYGKINQPVLDSITSILKRTYHTEIVVLNGKKLPEKAFVNIKSPRYRADSLLIELSKSRPDSIGFILGITSKDISTTKRGSDGNIKKPKSKYTDWGVFGLGYKPGTSCIISTFRLRNVKTDLFISRVQKISVHEIGHNLGLDHCETEKCVMQDAVETISTVDSEGFKLCEKCYRKI
ncbi:matrixin family metalloprotease [Aquimarina sp. AU58]|uniref:matrixin family metalloprotease n=1 Tax=Aquimarina sp. AU58 TaxID=1874112 RepID=UPI000D64333A|nr:matrixin family metalloprotease [Aquimarina sp. AU58]